MRSDIEVQERLQSLNEWTEEDDPRKAKEKLKVFERTRCLQVWHDASSLANHGHVVFMVDVLYDKALYLTDDEYCEKTGTRVNI